MYRPIEPGLSIFLDLIRVTAAVIVMLAHAQVSGLIAVQPGLLELAPAAVIVFFVLSGYIIESTTARQAGLAQYSIRRAARIYSVVLPALLLSIGLAAGYAAAQGGAELAAFWRDWGQWWRLPVVLTFQAEDWGAAVEVPWDGPFWSMNYEVFYYVLYAVLTFLTGRLRIVATTLVCLLAGPKILLLLPCWWIGVELARRPQLRFPSRTMAWAGLILASGLLLGLAMAGMPGRISYYQAKVMPGMALLAHSREFLGDYLMAVLVAAMIMAVRQLQFGPETLLVRCGKPLTWAAGYTFSIYLLHRPLQHLASRFYQYMPGDAFSALLLGLLIVLVIIAIGSVTERRTATWRQAISRIVQRRPA